MGKKSRFSESLEAIFWVKNRIRNLFDPVSGIRDGKVRIRDKHPGSSTLLIFLVFPDLDHISKVVQYLDQRHTLRDRRPLYNCLPALLAG
jgi:hypothetical protein